jgi:serine/threonine protein kinase
LFDAVGYVNSPACLGLLTWRHRYLKREQDVLRQLSHPNIVQFIGLCAEDGFLWLVSEFVANGNLTKLLYDTTKELVWSRRIHFGLDAIQAVAFIHSKSMMHRDLK